MFPLKECSLPGWCFWNKLESQTNQGVLFSHDLGYHPFLKLPCPFKREKVRPPRCTPTLGSFVTPFPVPLLIEHRTSLFAIFAYISCA